MKYMAAPDEATSDYTLWELAVLGFLREKPMHPYEMQRLLRERHKDEVLALKTGSLYHAIRRLQRTLLIEPIETSRNGRRPERTTYRLTEKGSAELLRWLRRLIATPPKEPSEFMASLSFLVILSPEDAAVHLAARVVQLQGEIQGGAAYIEELSNRIGRINVIELEYAHAMRQAELAWVRSLLEDLRSGRFQWDFEAMVQSIHASQAADATAKLEAPQ